MKIVVGLGNVGDKYAYTYHNMGFLAAEALADRLGFKFKKRECDAFIAEGNFNGHRVVLAKPLTFMNLSGVSVKQLLRKYGAGLDDLTVVYDDIDIEKGTVRARLNGSAGTHNGMRNIIEVLGSKEFKRVRIGIGRPCEGRDLADYVLSDVPKNERQTMADAIEKAADSVIEFIGFNDA